MLERLCGVIPVRMGSSRFPGKPLCNILGRSMLEIIYENVSEALGTDNTFVAGCDDEIREHCYVKGLNYVATRSDHTRASDRSIEAFRSLEMDRGLEFGHMVMIQGDEPCVTPGMIQAVCDAHISGGHMVTNIVSPIRVEAEVASNDLIKVVLSSQNDILYLSRSVIPSAVHASDEVAKNWLKQVCVIPFSKSAIDVFERTEESFLEKVESIDMLRFLENGFQVRAYQDDTLTHPVDRVEDVEKVELILKQRIGNSRFL